MENEKGVIFSDMKDLRTKTSKEGGPVQFKKHLYGIREKDVEEHVASVVQQFNRAEEAYKDRIDEFTIQTEMLTNQCSDLASQLKNRSGELNEARENLLSLENENSKLQNAIRDSAQRIVEMEASAAEQMENEESATGLQHENDYLKEELYEMQRTRDLLAGENAVVKKQLKDTDDLLTLANREKNELLENAVLIRSTIRQNEMRKSLAFSKFTEKQNYAMDQTTKKMKELISSIEEMKNDISILHDSTKENPLP